MSLHDAAVSRYIGMDGYRTLTATIEEAVTGGAVASCELTLRNRGKTAYLRASVRVIARTDDRYLCYGMITNLTDLRMAERKQRDTAVQLRALLENIEGAFRSRSTGERRSERSMSATAFARCSATQEKNMKTRCPVQAISSSRRIGTGWRPSCGRSPSAPGAVCANSVAGTDGAR